jgi:hypothetical protein
MKGIRPGCRTFPENAAMTISPTRIIPRLLLVALAALALAACETTGSGAPAPVATAPEPPMTRTRAAEQCWMSTEKGATSASLDKRADIVNKCIEDKMKAAKGGPAG